MADIKEGLLKLAKMIISLGIFIGAVSTIIFTYVHVKMLPIEVCFYPQEVILFLSMILLYLFSRRYKMRCIKIIGVIALILGMFNLIGFKIIIRLIMRG